MKGLRRTARTVELGYVPTQKQRVFHAAAADEVLFGGAAGGGKSCAVVMDAALRCMKTPGLQAYLFRRTYRELEDSLILQAHKLLGALGSYDREMAVWQQQQAARQSLLAQQLGLASTGKKYDTSVFGGKI